MGLLWIEVGLNADNLGCLLRRGKNNKFKIMWRSGERKHDDEIKRLNHQCQRSLRGCKKLNEY